MFETVKTFLAENIGTPYSSNIITAILLAGIALVAYLSYKLARFVIPYIEHYIVNVSL